MYVMDILDRAICSLPSLKNCNLCFPEGGRIRLLATAEENISDLRYGRDCMVGRLQGTREKIGITVVPWSAFV